MDRQKVPGDDDKIRMRESEEQLVASIVFKGKREDIDEKAAAVMACCGDAVCGEPIVLFDFGVYSDEPEIEVCIPVSRPVNKDGIRSRVLGSERVISVVHRGSRAFIRDTHARLREYMHEHAIVGAFPIREVTMRSPDNQGGDAVIELQIGLHGWGRRLIEGLERALGQNRRRDVIGEDMDLDDPSASGDQRFASVKSCMEKLRDTTDDREKYEILSCCADRFSEKRIARMRALYEKTGSVDSVIAEMSKDFAWYEAPKREGSVIYVTKIPYNKEEYEKAESPEEKRKHYCHCVLVRERLDEGMPGTYCNCGSGWYRQQWEGVLGKPVNIRLLKSLLMGDDDCRFAIELPEDVPLK